MVRRSPLLFLRVMLGLQPHGDHLIVETFIPPSIDGIELLGIPGRWGAMDTLGRSHTEKP
ncbi:hypothetical protein Van01_64170 [Micromonospora andamanensis]|uniref:Uncharacterized protein n=1 Tax=Micromonospora andamanensis TaxID=1287068 RepID=A0ABQ4I5S7_9ACTN|nr:hypothetical protein Van01_64170 [Micromonospora andamanensis]